jgi:pumilio RNA-binding family
MAIPGMDSWVLGGGLRSWANLRAASLESWEMGESNSRKRSSGTFCWSYVSPLLEGSWLWCYQLVAINDPSIDMNY